MRQAVAPRLEWLAPASFEVPQKSLAVRSAIRIVGVLAVALLCSIFGVARAEEDNVLPTVTIVGSYSPDQRTVEITAGSQGEPRALDPGSREGGGSAAPASQGNTEQ